MCTTHSLLVCLYHVFAALYSTLAFHYSPDPCCHGVLFFQLRTHSSSFASMPGYFCYFETLSFHFLFLCFIFPSQLLLLLFGHFSNPTRFFRLSGGLTKINLSQRQGLMLNCLPCFTKLLVVVVVILDNTLCSGTGLDKQVTIQAAALQPQCYRADQKQQNYELDSE